MIFNGAFSFQIKDKVLTHPNAQMTRLMYLCKSSLNHTNKKTDMQYSSRVQAKHESSVENDLILLKCYKQDLFSELV